ncbi:MAG: hypothetical protein J6C80_03875 [Flavobacteriales bacterium]|nr:hypothetical protein [Flavobacteriales bacterium]
MKDKRYPSLEKIYNHLCSSATQDKYIYVPTIWEDINANVSYRRVKESEYYHHIISSIISLDDGCTDYSRSLSLSTHSDKRWTEDATIYNAFVRLTSALPSGLHSGSEISTGTFLRMIAMLPYIKSLGADTLYLLPVNKIGEDCRTGELGSPYATRDLYSFDENLADAALDGIAIEEQFAALVEAAHMMGIRVVLEYAMRTSSPDGIEVKNHPEWYYWIHRKCLDNYSSPEFTPEQLHEIKQVPYDGSNYIAPSKSYRNQFLPAPHREEITLDGNKYVAKTQWGEAVIPGAFADWPPDDIQPAWKDVTYLRMYDREPSPKSPCGFNYIAYNTIRFYDPALSQNRYAVKSLWDYLEGVIPHYQNKYGLDGAMIDMGHAIPRPLIKRIIDKARSIDPAFAFYEENFYPTPASRKAGYDASLGFGWECYPTGMERILSYCAEKKAMTMFGTQETHNTPRSTMRYGTTFSRMGYAIMAFLPHIVPFIHSGYELGEKMPVNTGVGFSADESSFYRSLPLALFNKGMYQWDSPDNITRFISRINDLRQKNISLVKDTSIESYDRPHIESYENDCIAYRRIDPKEPQNQIIVIANTNMYSSRKFYLHAPYSGDSKVMDTVSGMLHTFTNDWLSYEMRAGEVLVLKLGK